MAVRYVLVVQARRHTLDAGLTRRDGGGRLLFLGGGTDCILHFKELPLAAYILAGAAKGPVNTATSPEY